MPQRLQAGTRVKNTIFLKNLQFSENHFFRGFKLSAFTYQYKNSENKFQIWQKLPFFILDFRLQFPGNEAKKLKFSPIYGHGISACFKCRLVFKPYFETPKLVLKSELTEDKLYFFSVSYLQLIKQHINVCKAKLCKIGSGSRYNKSRSRKRKGFPGNLCNSTNNNQQQVINCQHLLQQKN